jgi:aminoglycoside phosphotransferase family enzyme
VSLDMSIPVRAPTLADKVAFLSQASTYGLGMREAVVLRETHMSWVFLAGDKVYKLKKPVRFPYLDFSTLAQRETACRAELKLNRRLARDVYLDVEPLVLSQRGLSIGGAGPIVDWLVVMRRLDEYDTLEHTLLESRVEQSQLDRLVSTLAEFYRTAQRVFTVPAVQMAEWRRSLTFNNRILLEPRLGLPSSLIRRIDAIQRSFLARCPDLLAERARGRRILDGHGDLRPEHIWLTDGIRIIDCLEFNTQLRAVDPFDEIAYLSLECERLGARWIGDYCHRKIAEALHDNPPTVLYRFYRCHRAMLRARLAIAHLLETQPRTPEKWPAVARAYLTIAAREAIHLERLIRTREDGSAVARPLNRLPLRPEAAPQRAHAPSGGPIRARGGTAALHP